MVKTTKETKETTTVQEPKYSKADILNFDGFRKIERDFLKALLPEGRYTIDEAKKTLNQKLKGVVK